MLVEIAFWSFVVGMFLAGAGLIMESLIRIRRLTGTSKLVWVADGLVLLGVVLFAASGFYLLKNPGFKL